MDTIEYKYFVARGIWDSDGKDEFKPEDVQSYYDIFDDGDIVYYIEVEVDGFLGLWTKREVIGYHESYINVEEIRKPQRMNCKGETT